MGHWPCPGQGCSMQQLVTLGLTLVVTCVGSGRPNSSCSQQTQGAQRNPAEWPATLPCVSGCPMRETGPFSRGTTSINFQVLRKTALGPA